MRIRRCGLDDCTALECFQSSVKYFQVGRCFISDRIPTPAPIPERSSPTLSLSPREGGLTPTPLFMTEGQKDMIPPPFGRAGVGFSIIFSGGPGGASHHPFGRAGGGFSSLWLPRKKTASIKLKTSKYQTEKQNNLFWFAIRA